MADEKLKLRANYFNGMAIAVAAIGAFAPTVSFVTGGTNASPVTMLLVFVVCTAVSGFTHHKAQQTLEDLRDE